MRTYLPVPRCTHIKHNKERNANAEHGAPAIHRASLCQHPRDDSILTPRVNKDAPRPPHNYTHMPVHSILSINKTITSARTSHIHIVQYKRIPYSSSSCSALCVRSYGAVLIREHGRRQLHTHTRATTERGVPGIHRASLCQHPRDDSTKKKKNPALVITRTYMSIHIRIIH